VDRVQGGAIRFNRMLAQNLTRWPRAIHLHYSMSRLINGLFEVNEGCAGKPHSASPGRPKQCSCPARRDGSVASFW
jgi:hypothetical protein